MKKLLKKLDKKTDWVYPLYFYVVHAFGILMFSLLITSVPVTYIPGLEKYSFLVSLGLYILLILFSYKIANRLIRKWLIITSMIVGALYFLVRIIFLKN